MIVEQRDYHVHTGKLPELVRLGALAMSTGKTALALESFEGAREAQGDAFRHDLELGVLYLAERRFAGCRWLDA